MLHRRADEVYKTDLAEMFHADDDAVLKTGYPIINEERLTISSDGADRWVLTTKVPLYDDDGAVSGLVGISRDITDRREAEAKQRDAERLQIKVEREREVVELKQRFITTASHDFRTPLAIIMTNVDLLDRYVNQLSSKQRTEKLHQIREKVQHMTNLLDDVLTLSKAGAGRIELSPAPFPLETFCTRIWEDMLMVNEGKHPATLSYRATVEQFFGDKQILQNAFVNLLSNAFKYTPDGKHIEFEITNDTQQVVFVIRDEGYGIPEADMKRLFQPFHRASNVKDIEGTGLGLAIAKEYIELHSGTIHVESKEGEGTIFIVRLPRNS